MSASASAIHSHDTRSQISDLNQCYYYTGRGGIDSMVDYVEVGHLERNCQGASRSRVERSAARILSRKKSEQARPTNKMCDDTEVDMTI